MSKSTPKFWNIRRSPERDELVEALRKQLKNSGREVDITGGQVTTASVFDTALKELKKILDAEQASKKG